MNQTSASPKKIFVLDDHPVFREGLVQLLNAEPDLKVCGEAGEAGEALKAIIRLQPDLVLVDITLPGKSGLDLIKEIRTRDQKIKLLVLSMHDEAVYAARALRAGGDGYVMKRKDADEIIHAVRDVLAGRVYVSEEVLAALPKTSKQRGVKKEAYLIDRLTDSELDILELLGWGKSNAEIARQLRSSVKEIDARCTRMRRKLKLRTTNALIRYAVCWIEMHKA